MGAQCSNWGMESSQSSPTSPEVRPGVAGSPVWFSQPYNERKTKAGILSLGISDVVQGSQWHGEASVLGGGGWQVALLLLPAPENCLLSEAL